MPCAPNAFTLSGRVTICHDNSATTLGEIHDTVFPQAPFHDFTKEGFHQACANPSDTVNLIGFGEPGVIYTGAGFDRETNDTKFISQFNVPQVEQWYRDQAPRAASSLFLCGCDTGAHAKGQALLNALSNALNITVHAPTGAVFLDKSCGQLYLEKRARWISASPHVSAPAEAPPNPHDDDSPPHNIALFERGSHIDSSPVRKDFPAHTVKMIAAWDAQTRMLPRLESPLASLRFLHLDDPFIESEVTLAVVTGGFTLTTADAGIKWFNILNNRLIQDATIPSVYYYANISGFYSTML